MTRAEELVERLPTGEGLGSVSTSVAQVFSLLNDPRASAADFERVVRPDPGMTAQVLRSANSAFYRGAREVNSVRDAIARMGQRRVFEIAASASFARAIPSEVEGYGLSAEHFWAHAVATAVLADRVGREAGFTYPDLAFTIGLLHDLGKLVAARFLTEHPSLRRGRALTTDDEVELLGTTHGELAEALAVKWGLPREIGAVTRWHHHPSDAPSATLRYLASVIQLADQASALAGFGDDERAVAALDGSTLERLGLNGARVENLVGLAKPEIERTLDLLSSQAPRRRTG